MAMDRIAIEVCFIISADSAESAYRRLVSEMRKVDAEDFQWESTDEWRNARTGRLIDLATQARAIDAVLWKED